VQVASAPASASGVPEAKRATGTPQHQLAYLSVYAPAVHRVLNSSGQPLDPAVRRFFEPRFRQNLGHVRVHDDRAARASALAVGAQAYVVGRHLVLGPQSSGAGSEAGRRLMAHELAHLVGGGGGGPPDLATLTVHRVSAPSDAAEQHAELVSEQVLRGMAPSTGAACALATLWRRPASAGRAAPARPFHQEALDALAAERRRIITIVQSQMIPDSVPALERLVALCEAIEVGDRDRIKAALQTLLAANARHLPLSSPSESLIAEMAARLILQGLDSEAESLRRWGLAREKASWPPSRGPFERDIYAWERITERLLEQVPDTGGAEALRVLDGLLVLLAQLVRERFTLDAEEIKKDAATRAAMYDNYFVQRDRTISVYASELVRMMREVFIGMQSAFQIVLDVAAADLASGQSPAMLSSAKDRLEGRLLPLIEPAERSRHIGGVPVETTVSEFDQGGGVHKDALARPGSAQAKRTVKFHFYDVEQPPWSASEMSSDFAGVFLARRRQIALIEELFGVKTDARGQRTPEAKENASAMATLGPQGLRLHSDDDWRRFVLAKFEAREAVEGPEKALVAVIQLLEAYLRVFTTHTPYDIDDFGDNLLTRSFPRDLAGRLVHDCGVYALRIAYILSLLRDHPKLKLRFRYVVMPVHVGLLITGDGLPMFMANNDAITRYHPSDVAAMRREWDQLDERGAVGPSTTPGTEGRFAGEVMADAFITGVDLPYRVLEVVRTKGSPAAIKDQLWQQYTRLVAPAAQRLFGPTTRDPASPNYQFHLQYLRLMALMRQHHNTVLVPFWNVKASELWKAHKARITTAHAALSRAGPRQRAAARKAYDAAVTPYIQSLEAALSAVQSEASEILLTQVAIQEHLAKHPEVFAARAEVGHANRVDAMFTALGIVGMWWERRIYEHLSDLRSATGVDAPFERPEDKLMPLS